MKKLLVVFVVALCAVCASAQTKEVARYMFTTAIVDREPTDTLSTYTAATGGTVYFFTELKDMQGQAHHLWYKNGELVYDFTANVNGSRWRTYSNMKSDHFKAGDEVKVEVTDDSGAVLATAVLAVN